MEVSCFPEFYHDYFFNYPSNFTCKRCHPKKKGPKAEAVKHQKQLAEFIEEKKAADADSGISDDSSERDSSSPTVYVAENLEDLADEGVNIKSMNAIKSKTVVGRIDEWIYCLVCTSITVTVAVLYCR